ncbi:hypothetical protein ACIXUO_19465 [Bacteroides fragilis]
MIHCFDDKIAKELGIEAACVLHNFAFWINKNIADNHNYFEGRYWTYNTREALSKLFPYMNSLKIYRVIGKLEEEGYILKGNFNKSRMDRTTWYALTEKCISMLVSCGYTIIGYSYANYQKCKMQVENMNNASCMNEQTIPDSIYTDSNTKLTNVNYSIATHEESVLFPVEKKPLASEIFGFTAKALDVTKKVIERTDSFFDQLTFPFESEEFKKAFYVLMTQPKWRVKTKTITAMQANLNEIAQFEEGFAMLLINQSISKGWASLVYESTPKQYMQWLREKTGVSGNTQSANNTKSYFQSDEQRRMYQSYLTEDFT